MSGGLSYCLAFRHSFLVVVLVLPRLTLVDENDLDFSTLHIKVVDHAVITYPGTGESCELASRDFPASGWVAGGQCASRFWIFLLIRLLVTVTQKLFSTKGQVIRPLIVRKTRMRIYRNGPIASLASPFSRSRFPRRFCPGISGGNPAQAGR